jgi:hypothetical protein
MDRLQSGAKRENVASPLRPQKAWHPLEKLWHLKLRASNANTRNPVFRPLLQSFVTYGRSA